MSMESVYKLSIMVNMLDKASNPAASIQRAVGGATQEVANFSQQAMDSAKGGTAMIATGNAIAKAAGAPVKATFKTQDALAELSSLGISALNDLENAAEQFSMTWAGTTKAEFLTAAYDIKSGISTLTDAGVADMTRLAGVTAKATKSTANEMTSLFATGYGIYKDYYSQLSDLEFGEMFSAGIAKSVQQFKTTGSGMAQAISSLGGTATAAGAPLEEQLAILGMLQATMSGSEAGTKYSAFLQNAARAGDELGLSFTDTNGQLKGMPEILTAIKGKFGEVMTAADKVELQKAFGTIEAVKLIDLMYGKTDDLQGNILTLYDTMGEGMKITEDMANAINAPPSQSWIVMQQQLQAITELAGNAMLPAFQHIQAQLQPVLELVADWVRENPKWVSGILYTVAAFGALLSIVGACKIGYSLLMMLMSAKSIIRGNFIDGWELLIDKVDTARLHLWNLGDKLAPLKTKLLTLGGGIKTVAVGMFAWVKQGIMSAIAALPGLIASVWSFTAALLANPITWVVIGVVALIAALILLWQNWDTVVQWFTTGFEKIMGWFTSMPDWVQGLIAVFMPFIGIPLLIVEHWESIKAFFVGLIDWFKNIGASIMQGFTTGIQSFLNSPFEAVKGALEKVRSLLPFSDAKTGPLSDLTLSGSRVFSTFNDGMLQTADLPADTVGGAFGKAELEPEVAGTGRGGKTTIIQKVVLYIKPDDIKDMLKLKKLLEEFEELNNSNIGFDPVMEV